ncbi:MAG: FKBP-type peptidyl-prolyl cis-trans isomerase [Gemmatimonadetes bacterium]|nr:FKBP-type peptidyl-prolyl cis-trans isomerase [Gemmatimonadota bacterium]
MNRRVVLLASAVFAIACAGGPSPVTDDIPASAIAPSLGINLAEYTRTPEGLFYKDVTVGDGPVADDRSKVTVAYRGLLANGTQVDSSAGLTFKMGSGQVIKGWQIGLRGMHAGGARILVIPPHLGYGWKEVGPIPSNAVLLFRVQLVAVK